MRKEYIIPMTPFKQYEAKFAVVIPTFQECENLTWLIPAIITNYQNCKVIVVDDFSEDGTARLIDDINASHFSSRVHLIQRFNSPSYAQSLLEGIRYAIQEGFETVIQMDADGSHPVAEIYQLSQSNADVVIASRYVRGSKVVGVPIRRIFISKLGNIFLKLTKQSRVKDQTNGFRAFGKNALRVLKSFNSSETGFSIQIEILRHLESQNLLIVELPTTFEFRTIGNSKFTKSKLLEAFMLSLRNGRHQ